MVSGPFHNQPHSLSLTHTHTLSLSLTLSLTHTHTLSLLHTLTHSCFLSLPLALALSLTHPPPPLQVLAEEMAAWGVEEVLRWGLARAEVSSMNSFCPWLEELHVVGTRAYSTHCCCFTHLALVWSQIQTAFCVILGNILLSELAHSLSTAYTSPLRPQNDDVK